MSMPISYSHDTQTGAIHIHFDDGQSVLVDPNQASVKKLLASGLPKADQLKQKIQEPDPNQDIWTEYNRRK
jgi:hypothetical protein